MLGIVFKCVSVFAIATVRVWEDLLTLPPKEGDVHHAIRELCHD